MRPNWRGLPDFSADYLSEVTCSFAATIARSTSAASAFRCSACLANSSRLCRTVVRALINAGSAGLLAQGFQMGSIGLHSAGLTGFVRIVHLHEEIADHGHGVFEPIATVAVDRCFCAVIKQFEPKQRRAIKKIGGQICQHANLMTANRSEQNRCSRSTLGNGAELEVSFVKF